MSRINVQNPELTLDHKPPLICRTLPWGFAGFIPVIRQLNAPICRTLTVRFTVRNLGLPSVLLSVFALTVRFRQQFSTGGVATPYLVHGHAKENTTQIRRYDDGLVLYFTLCLHVLCFLNAMGFNWCISVWWFNLAGALQASRF